MVEFFSVSAFSDLPVGGNLAAVVVDAPNLGEDEMQFIAGKIGYSETAFVFPSAAADFKLRFFTPSGEVDLCGHATIAAFSQLARLKRIGVGRYTQETKAGIFDVEVIKTGQVFMSQAKPIYGDYVEQTVIADSLGVDVSELHPIFLPQIVSTGVRDIFIPLKNLKALHELKPNFAKISKLSLQRSVIGYHVFCLDSLFGGFAHCRNFAPLYDIPEEAATGTASGALACYLYGQGLLADNAVGNIVFEQGFSMNRPSQITARLEVEDGAVTRVEVGGNTCFMEGPVPIELRSKTRS